MRNFQVLLLIVAAFVTHSTFANNVKFDEKCSNLQNCIDYVSKLLGQKYVYPEGFVVRKVRSTKNVEITKDNAEILLTSALYDNQYTRIPLGPANSFKIVELLKAPKNAVPTFNAVAPQKPDLPKVWDVVTVNYKVRYPHVALYMLPRISEYMPGTGLVTTTSNNTIIVTAAAPEVARVLQIIDGFDQEVSANELKSLEEQRKQRTKTSN